MLNIIWMTGLNCNVVGAPRYGLEGVVIGCISEKEALLAQEKLIIFD